ncbi:hypothetical protein PCLA_01f0023 [Pseudomonas citronellolis]|nr:hypothetical protein PCLA_01f0023 [Pseudomonas citronellolis]
MHGGTSCSWPAATDRGARWRAMLGKECEGSVAMGATAPIEV